VARDRDPDVSQQIGCSQGHPTISMDSSTSYLGFVVEANLGFLVLLEFQPSLEWVFRACEQESGFVGC
jgi:hypothetical protein